VPPGQRSRRWSGVPLEDRQALRREELVAAGVQLLGEASGPAVTVRAVCRQAELTERYFYESFADRDEFVRAVYDDIKQSRQIKDVNNFWKYLAHDPATLKRTWESLKQIMAPGALDAVTKEMVYLAVSVTNGCGYCIASHGAAARKAGMTEAMFGELMAVVGRATEAVRLGQAERRR